MGLMLSPEAREAHKDLKIVYTPIHGSGVEIVPEFLAKLGFENVYLPQNMTEFNLHYACRDVEDDWFESQIFESVLD